jgi:hypothetical protein
MVPSIGQSSNVSNVYSEGVQFESYLATILAGILR